MLNAIWIAMIVGALIFGALNQTLPAVALASTDSAKAAIDLVIGLVGVMAFWLGLMRVLQKGGLLRLLARGLKPITTRLFPDVPADHPAMSMMILNIVSNMLGLGNAATPFGLKAMVELNKLNREKGTATNAMALFLAINTSNIALLPTGVIALRASLGSHVPGSILLPTLMATSLSTLVAIVAAKLLQRLPVFRVMAQQAGKKQQADLQDSLRTDADSASLQDSQANPHQDSKVESNPKADSKNDSQGDAPASAEIDISAAQQAFEQADADSAPASIWARAIGWSLVFLSVGVLLYALYRQAQHPVLTGGVAGWGAALNTAITEWPLVLLIVGFVLYGLIRGVNVYDAIVEGGREAFDITLRFVPFLIVILVGIGMLRASGAIDMMVQALSPLTAWIGMPAEALPMALLRPLSGSGAYGVAAEIMKSQGPDSLVGQIVSTMQGSTETTFYVLALYFGVVQIKKTRHTIFACLIADTAGILGAVWACRLLLG